MALASDPLLNSSVELKPRSSMAKAPENTGEPRKQERSSFAQVYAKERQAKADERQEAASRERARGSDGNASETEPAVAGKELPEDDGSQVDPALLLALAGQLPVEDIAEGELGDESAATEDTAPAGEEGSAAVIFTTPPGQMTEASHDPQVDALNEANGLRQALGFNKPEAGPSAQAAAPKSTAGGAPSLTAAVDESVEGEVTSLKGKFDSLGEAPQTAQAEPRNDSVTHRFNALTQAIQQTLPNQRAAEAPGQGLSPQAGNFSEALVDKVMWMSSQNLKSAEIKLDPAELGRLEVRVQLSHEQTQVSFSSAHASVREALEGQVHRLREMLAQQGMNSVDVNVSDQSTHGRQNDGNERGQSQFRGGFASAEEDVVSGSSEIRSSPASGGRGLVDYYA